MASLRIRNKYINISRYLTQGELRSLSLGAPARLILRLRGAVRLGAAKPRRFRAPVDFYLVGTVGADADATPAMIRSSGTINISLFIPTPPGRRIPHASPACMI